LFKTSAGSRMLNACQAEQNLPYQWEEQGGRQHYISRN
jgi:hypothetical protein